MSQILLYLIISSSWQLYIKLVVLINSSWFLRRQKSDKFKDRIWLLICRDYPLTLFARILPMSKTEKVSCCLRLSSSCKAIIYYHAVSGLSVMRYFAWPTYIPTWVEKAYTFGAATPGFNSLILAPSVPSLGSTEPIELLCSASNISTTDSFCFVKQKQGTVEVFLQFLFTNMRSSAQRVRNENSTAIKAAMYP